MFENVLSLSHGNFQMEETVFPSPTVLPKAEIKWLQRNADGEGTPSCHGDCHVKRNPHPGEERQRWRHDGVTGQALTLKYRSQMRGVLSCATSLT